MRMILNFSDPSLLLTSPLSLNKLYLMSTIGCHLAFFLSIPLRLRFFLLVFLNNSQNSVILSFIYLPINVTLSPVQSAPNLGVIFDSNLTLSQHISAVATSCLYYIRDNRRIRNTIDHTAACVIATSLIHSKLDYRNFLLMKLPSTQTKRL
jgi:hypothetical protein